VELDPASGKAAQIVERRGKIPSKAVEVVHDDGASTDGLDPLGQALEAFTAPARIARRRVQARLTLPNCAARWMTS